MDTIIINESESIIRNILDLIVGLVLNVQTDVSNIYHLERRYEKLEDVLRDLGGDVKKFNN